jgi:hypothetical protein
MHSSFLAHAPPIRRRNVEGIARLGSAAGRQAERDNDRKTRKLGRGRGENDNEEEVGGEGVDVGRWKLGDAQARDPVSGEPSRLNASPPSYLSS